MKSGRRAFVLRKRYILGIVDFQDASNLRFASTVDPQTIILIEFTFLNQELQFCNEADTDSLNSLTLAIQSFDDALLALSVVEDRTLYHAVDKTHPHSKKYRAVFPRIHFMLRVLRTEQGFKIYFALPELIL